MTNTTDTTTPTAAHAATPLSSATGRAMLIGDRPVAATLGVAAAGFAVVGGAGSHWYQAHLNPDRDADGAVVGVIVSTRDITALKVAEQELAHRATHDSLTGLANRGLVVERAAQHLGDGTGRLGVLFVDVDDFKQINDLYGHEVGDHVLVEIADRLRALARRGDTVARLGGDEFVMLCQDVPDDVALEHLTCRVSSALAEPIVTDGLVLPLAVAVLTAVPASTSVCVTAYGLPLHVAVAPGASAVGVQVTVPAFGSFTPTLVSVTLPVLVTTKV